MGSTPGEAVMEVVRPGPATFSNAEVNTGSNSLVRGFLTGHSGLTELARVDVIRLDDYARNASLDPTRIGLVKIDVEGYEAAVLAGMPRMLEHRPPILIEIMTAPERNPELDGARVLRLLQDAGYRCLGAVDLRPVVPGRIGPVENVLAV